MTLAKKPPQTPATVVVNYGQHATVLQQGQLKRACSLRRVGPIVAGDQVLLEARQSGLVITERLARQSVLERPDRRGQAKPIAANITITVIVSAPRPGISQRLIDQYLVAAHHIGCRALLVFNKRDLWQAADHEQVQALQADYQNIGLPSLCTSDQDSASIEALRQMLQQETAILLGQSGVGKSSLTNALLPDMAVRVGELSAASGQGAHTTTTTTLYPLTGYHTQTGGFLLDSPGVREFSLSHLPVEAIRQGFTEFATLGAECRFNNCLHRQEPNCAVQQALHSGAINPQRYAHYLELLEAAEQQPLWR